jgi:hypothetical protein
MTAQRDDPELRGPSSALGAARAGGAAQPARALRHRRGARRHDPRRTRRAVRTRVVPGAGVELPRATPSSAGGRAVVRQGPRPWPARPAGDHSVSACAGSVAGQPAAGQDPEQRRARGPATRVRSARITAPIAADAFEARSGMVRGGDAERPRPVPRAVSRLLLSSRPRARSGPRRRCGPVAGAKLGGAAGPSESFPLGSPCASEPLRGQGPDGHPQRARPAPTMSGQLIAQVCQAVFGAERGVPAGAAGRPAARSLRPLEGVAGVRAGQPGSGRSSKGLESEPEDRPLGTDQAGTAGFSDRVRSQRRTQNRPGGTGDELTSG